MKDGDLIHADLHGVVTIPHEIAREVTRAAAEVEKGERGVIDLCRSPEFSIDALVAKLSGR